MNLPFKSLPKQILLLSKGKKKNVLRSNRVIWRNNSEIVVIGIGWKNEFRNTLPLGKPESSC